MKLRVTIQELRRQGLHVQVWNDNAPSKDTLIAQLDFEGLPFEDILSHLEDPGKTASLELDLLTSKRFTGGGKLNAQLHFEKYTHPLDTIAPRDFPLNTDPFLNLRLSNISVRDLPETEMGAMIGRKQDPFLKVWCANPAKVRQTTVKDEAGKEANWGEEVMNLRMMLHDLRHGLQIQVWNDNAPASDTLIAQTEYEDLPFDDIRKHWTYPELTTDVTLRLLNAKGYPDGGVLNCTLRFDEYIHPLDELIPIDFAEKKNPRLNITVSKTSVPTFCGPLGGLSSGSRTQSPSWSR